MQSPPPPWSWGMSQAGTAGIVDIATRDTASMIRRLNFCIVASSFSARLRLRWRRQVIVKAAPPQPDPPTPPQRRISAQRLHGQQAAHGCNSMWREGDGSAYWYFSSSAWKRGWSRNGSQRCHRHSGDFLPRIHRTNRAYSSQARSFPFIAPSPCNTYRADLSNHPLPAYRTCISRAWRD